MKRSLYLPLVVLLTWLPASQGQMVPPPLPAQGPSPLLFVRFLPPPGVHVTIYQGGANARELAAPCVVGLRPGYLYRVKLSGFNEFPGIALYPTLEVRGTVQMPPRGHAIDYPAPVTLHNEEIERVLRGTLLTKVVYLEHPNRALAVATKADEPLETDVPATRDPLQDARALGRPMLIWRLGERQVSAQELAACSVAGTVLFPGERVLPPAGQAPFLPWACVRVTDPIAGPRFPEEECLRDGGDSGAPAGLDRDGRLQGLDPSDTVAEYSDSKGRRRLTVSNRVCVCVPRFGVLRTELPVGRYEGIIEIGGMQAVQGRDQLKARLPSREAERYEQLQAMKGRQRLTNSVTRQGLGEIQRLEVLTISELDLGPAQFLGTVGLAKLTEIQRAKLARQMSLARELDRSTSLRGVDQIQGTAVVGRTEGLVLVTAVAETRDITVACNEEPQAPDKPMTLYKWVNVQTAQIGDVVTFYLKYTNHGGQPIQDVAVSDSLTARLEYVPGSSRADRNSVFTTQLNEAGSTVLRWEISGKLLPGQSGVVSFQAKVR